MVRAGNESETWKKLEAAVQKDPEDERARLDLADAEFAKGSRSALIKALVSAVEAGRLDGQALGGARSGGGRDRARALPPGRQEDHRRIREEPASSCPAPRARVLDYSAVWVHADGSSRMLSHEIIRVQSAEAIRDMAEQQVGNGLTLHFRVIKQDGSVLEPEFVSGKPTVTMPHLEVGDYIETESIESKPGDGPRARATSARAGSSAKRTWPTRARSSSWSRPRAGRSRSRRATTCRRRS